jgi:hypothetical protein
MHLGSRFVIWRIDLAVFNKINNRGVKQHLVVRLSPIFQHPFTFATPTTPAEVPVSVSVSFSGSEIL